MEALTLAEIETLLVEPSTTQYNHIVKCLSQVGIINIHHAKSGDEALRMMDSNKPDLVISAMHTPGISGTELVQAMRDDDGLRDLPFMLISSETHYRYLEPLRQAGVIAILPKPFDMEQLQAAIDSTVDYVEPGDVNSRLFSGENIKVLVVDDSVTARRHICRVLVNMGITDLVEAVNGVKALEIIGQEFFDIIVTDYNMPEMDGAELTNQIRNKSSQSSIPILMVSSESDVSRLASVQKAGVSAICDKPFDTKVVKELLNRFLE